MAVLYIALGIMAVVLMISLYTYQFVFLSPNKNQNDPHNIPRGKQYKPYKKEMLTLIDKLQALPYEKVSIVSDDGLRLSGRYYHIKDGAPLDIEFHGYRGLSVRDFCAGALFNIENGHNCLLPDERACGESEGRTITFGVKERYDCIRWAQYAEERFGENTDITLCGISMGASVVLMAAELGLPKSVKRIIADCGFTSPKEIIKKVCRDMHLPAGIVYPFIRLGALIFGGFDPNSADAEKSAKKITLPVLIIHGEDDKFVPCSMGKELYEACPPDRKTSLFVPGAGHGISFLVSPEKYNETVKNFSEIK